MKFPKIIYYKDELNDEFAGDSIKPRAIDENYWYGDNSFFFKSQRFFWYRIVAYPIAWLFLKLKYHHKIVGKSKIRAYKGKSVFMYANHTNNIADALIPSMLYFPPETFVVVNANNVSMPVLGKITPYLGALPLPDNLKATRNFMDTLKLRVNENKAAIMIYPEAHIWPFYTKIRPFTDLSFRYPLQFKTPAFCFTNTYQKCRFSKNPKIVTYVDGPFFADETLGKKERQEDLRNRIYDAMTERSKNSNVEIIKYESLQQ